MRNVLPRVLWLSLRPTCMSVRASVAEKARFHQSLCLRKEVARSFHSSRRMVRVVGNRTDVWTERPRRVQVLNLWRLSKPANFDLASSTLASRYHEVVFSKPGRHQVTTKRCIYPWSRRQRTCTCRHGSQIATHVRRNSLTRAVSQVGEFRVAFIAVFRRTCS